MVTVSLDAMAAGGMHDQIGGGFHRYSVDDYWLVPHFEKMLYDQALLAGAYLRAWPGHGTGEPRYRAVVEDDVEYVLRDLAHPLGGFFSAEDADSEGVEGKFYCWQLDEIEAVCGDDTPAAIRYFGVTPQRQLRRPAHGLLGEHPPRGRPHRGASRRRTACHGRHSSVHASCRVRPGLDDKVLLAWNALFTRHPRGSCGRARPRRLDACCRRQRRASCWVSCGATTAGCCVRGRAGGANPALPRTPRTTPRSLEALLTLAEVDDVAWLDEARTVATGLLDLFADDEHGGFFTTGSDAEALIVRPKDTQDNATPSESSLAANGLLRLAALSGDDTFAEAAARCVHNLAPVIGEHPTAFAYVLGALERLVSPPIEIAVVGAVADPATRALRAEVVTRLIPASVAVTAAPDAGPGRSSPPATPLLAGRTEVGGSAAAYVCERYACRAPVTTPEALRAEIDAALARAARPGACPGRRRAPRPSPSRRRSVPHPWPDRASPRGRRPPCHRA